MFSPSRKAGERELLPTTEERIESLFHLRSPRNASSVALRACVRSKAGTFALTISGRGFDGESRRK